MTRFVYSTDGTTVDSIPNPRKPPDPRGWPNLAQPGFFTPLDQFSNDEAMAECGIYRVTQVAPPPNDASNTYVEVTPVNTAPGVFEQAWQHDATAHTDRLESERISGLREALVPFVPTMRAWAEDARGTVVTNGNDAQVTQIVVDRLGQFFDKFADLIESGGI